MTVFLVHADGPSQYKLQIYTLKPFLSIGLLVHTCFVLFLNVQDLPKNRMPPVVDLVNQLNVFLIV